MEQGPASRGPRGRGSQREGTILRANLEPELDLAAGRLGVNLGRAVSVGRRGQKLLGKKLQSLDLGPSVTAVSEGRSRV